VWAQDDNERRVAGEWRQGQLSPAMAKEPARAGATNANGEQQILHPSALGACGLRMTMGGERRVSGGKGSCRRQWRKSRREPALQMRTANSRSFVALLLRMTAKGKGNGGYGKCAIAGGLPGRAILFDLFPPDGLSCRGGTETRVANPEGRLTREVGLSQNGVVLAGVFG
jgi:hypothetical protein